MILTRFVRTQLWIFSVAAIIAAIVLAVGFLQVPAMLGIGKSTIKAQFTDAARLYDRAEVTYRGASVGLVTELRLIPHGIEADLQISNTLKVPADTRAEIHSISAAGEQYVDLVPTSDTGRYLGDGDTIPVSRTTVPPQIGPILDQTNALLAALPKPALNKLIDESYNAFRGVGPDIGRVIDNSTNLVEAAQQDFPATSNLLDDAGPLLDTQVQTSPQIRDLTRNLAAVTDQLRGSDTDFRAVLEGGGPFTDEVDELIGDLRPVLPTALGNSVDLADLLRGYNANLAQVATVYPALTAAVQGVVGSSDVRGRHYANVDLMGQFNDPPPCYTGFIPPAQWRDPNDLSTRPTPTVYCATQPDNPTDVRGARNLPCEQDLGARAASPADCRKRGTRIEDKSTNRAFPADSSAGRIVGPLFGERSGAPGSTEASPPDMTWQRLLLGPARR